MQRSMQVASLDEAYSLEYGDFIGPELAYDLYWAGVIGNKSAFICPSEFCDAKVTCINIDKEKQDMHQSPHFRGYNHAEDCDATLGGGGENPIVEGGEGSRAEVSKADEIPDVFHLKRPENQFAKNPDLRGRSAAKKSERRRKRLIEEGGRRSGSDYYSVRSLVSKFIRYRKSETLRDHKVNISGKNISYDGLFKGVYRQPIEALPDERLIYWGVAFIDYLEKQRCYQVKFAQPLSWEGREMRPSFFIHDDLIDAYPVRNLVVKRLEKIRNSDERRAFVFLYSRPYGVERGGSKYINFEFDSLDYLEIRFLDLFDDLKA